MISEHNATKLNINIKKNLKIPKYLGNKNSTSRNRGKGKPASGTYTELMRTSLAHHLTFESSSNNCGPV